MHTLLFEDLRVTLLLEIADSLGISVSSVDTILLGTFDFVLEKSHRPSGAPFVDRRESFFVRVAMRKQLLVLYTPDPEKIIQCLVRGDGVVGSSL